MESEAGRSSQPEEFWIYPGRSFNSYVGLLQDITGGRTTRSTLVESPLAPHLMVEGQMKSVKIMDYFIVCLSSAQNLLILSAHCPITPAMLDGRWTDEIVKIYGFCLHIVRSHQQCLKVNGSEFIDFVCQLSTHTIDA